MQTSSPHQRRVHTAASDSTTAPPRSPFFKTPQAEPAQSQAYDLSQVDLFSHDPGPRSVPRIQLKPPVEPPPQPIQRQETEAEDPVQADHELGELGAATPSPPAKPEQPTATPQPQPVSASSPAKTGFAHLDLFSHAPRRKPIQMKLTVGAPGDRYEQEADQVAAQVMNMAPPATPNVQHQQMAPETIQRDVLPVARFSPAPGIWIDRTENSVTITGAMELYGPEANAARAASIQNSINTTWSRTFPDGYSVSCRITVTYRGAGSSPGNATQIEAVNIAGPSHVSPGLSGRTMTLNATESNAFTWTAAHEFGHIIGLDDRYSEDPVSKIRGQFGGQRTNTVQSGYEGNIMAVDQGVLESQNIRDIAEENEPSAYWINDDDQVRDWVNAHSLSDIGRLSTNNKLRAIRTLMGGWISDEDINAIIKICSSVTSSSEANAIRNGVDLLDMTSIGQRTRVRVAFSRMP